MDFGQPNAEIGRKMVDGRLILALVCVCVCVRACVRACAHVCGGCMRVCVCLCGCVFVCRGVCLYICVCIHSLKFSITSYSCTLSEFPLNSYCSYRAILVAIYN